MVQYNYSHDNDGAGLLMAQFAGARIFSGNTIRYNVSQNDGRKNSMAGIHLWNGGSGIGNSDIYSNTVYIGPSGNGNPRAFLIDTPSTNLHVRNNIFSTGGGAKVTEVRAGQVGLLMQGNDYWSGFSPLLLDWGGQIYTTLLDWRNGSGQEFLAGAPTGVTVDPGLTALRGWSRNRQLRSARYPNCIQAPF